MTKKSDDAKQDRAVEDSFPASDPPAASGIVGPRGAHDGHARPASHKRDNEARPKGTPTHERHATETAHQSEHENKPKPR